MNILHAASTGGVAALRGRCFAWAQAGLLMVLALQGCAAFHPLKGVPASYVPDEFLGPSRSGKKTIDLSLLVQRQPAEYRLAAGDILSVYVPGVLGSLNVGPGAGIGETPPINLPRTPHDPPTIGYPTAVRDDGTISLPLVPPINVNGMTLAEAEETVRKAYTVDSHILNDERDRVLISLARRREYRVLVVRQETANELTSGIQPGTVNIGKSKRGTAKVVHLPAYENDVLHALAKAEGGADGLPGLDAKNTIYIVRRKRPVSRGVPDRAPAQPPVPSLPHKAFVEPPASATKAAPAIETAPVGEPAPVADTAPVIEPAPVVAPAPVVGAAPAANEASVTPAAPANDAVPASHAPAASDSHPPSFIEPPPYTGTSSLTGGHSPSLSSPPNFQTPRETVRPAQTGAAPASPPAVPSRPAGSSPRSVPETPIWPRPAEPAESLRRSSAAGVPVWGHASEPTVRGQSPAAPMPGHSGIGQPFGAADGTAAQGGMPLWDMPVSDGMPFGGHDESWHSHFLDFDPTIDNPNVVKIPIRLGKGERPMFTERDIILQDGDIVFIESRETEVFYTGGLLGGGQYTLPRDYDLSVLEAISVAQSPQSLQNQTTRNIGGTSALNMDVTFSASHVVILRKLANGTRMPIEVDLYKALRHPERENILIQPGDMVILQYTKLETIGAFFERHLLESALFGIAAAQFNNNGGN